MDGLSVDITRQWKEFALKVDFTVNQGCLGILGASGSGKSMTLKMIAGIVTPNDGYIQHGDTIFFHKNQKQNLAIQKRKVGYLFQNYALFPNMNVRENIAVGMLGTRQQKEKEVLRMIHRFQLEGLEERYPNQLSGGQQQRTALARILASKPEVLLLDEPFSAMDSYLKEELQIKLALELKQFSGITILVSHNRDEIYQLCDKTMIIHNGRNLICEDTKQLFKQPKYVEAARLTGCKNISKALRIGEHRVKALDWGIELEVEQDIPFNLSYIGVRAHDIIPIDTSFGNTGDNIIEVLIKEEVHTPFERTILFQNSSNPRGMLWMKMEQSKKEIPKYVKIEPEKVLLLIE